MRPDTIAQPTLFDGWCQRWHNGLEAWRHTEADHFQPHRYQVIPLDETTCKNFTTVHHYSRAWPAAKLRFGLIEDGEQLVGTCVLGVPMKEEVLTNPFPALEPYRQSVELSRLVLLDGVPANGESWFVSRVFKAAAGLGVRGVVAYSDPMPRYDACGHQFMPGHVGGVYGALGGIYYGLGKARMLTILPDGTVLNDRMLAKINGADSGCNGAIGRLIDMGAPRKPDGVPGREWLPVALEAVGARKVKHPGNHRYAWSIGPRWSRKAYPVALPRLPYPNRTNHGLAA